MKLPLSFALLLYVGLVFSQSKKKQIQQLSLRVDSLNSVLCEERKNSAQKTKDYTTQITSLNAQGSRLTADMQTLQQDLKIIRIQLKVKQDSLNLLNVELQKLKATVRPVVYTTPTVISPSRLEKMTAFIPPVIEDDLLMDAVPMQDQKLETEVSDEYFDPPSWDFDPPSPQPDDNLTFIEEEADFPGGAAEMAKFINENIDYPQEAIDSAIKGRVTVRFVVEKDGKVSNVSVAVPLAGCKACERAAVQVVEKMRWTPGKNGGEAVRTWVTLPIKFEVVDDQGPKPPKPLEEMTKKERRKWEKN